MLLFSHLSLGGVEEKYVDDILNYSTLKVLELLSETKYTHSTI